MATVSPLNPPNRTLLGPGPSPVNPRVLQALSLPVIGHLDPAFWGREDKDCPKCGNKILAMAVRCRHCGVQLEATPIDQSAYARKQAQKERAPFLRRMSIIFMILAIIPGCALLTLTLGWWFYARNRTAIRKLPGGADGLYRIAIIVSAVEIVVSLIGVTTFSIIDRLVR